MVTILLIMLCSKPIGLSLPSQPQSQSLLAFPAVPTHCTCSWRITGGASAQVHQSHTNCFCWSHSSRKGMGYTCHLSFWLFQPSGKKSAFWRQEEMFTQERFQKAEASTGGSMFSKAATLWGNVSEMWNPRLPKVWDAALRTQLHCPQPAWPLRQRRRRQPWHDDCSKSST